MTDVGPTHDQILDTIRLALRDRTLAAWDNPTDPIVALPPHVLTDAANLADDVGNHHLAELLRDATVIQPAAAARGMAETAADAALVHYATALDPHRTHQAAADQLEADGHHHLALRCRLAATYSAAMLGQHVDPPSTTVFAWLYDAVYPHAGLTGPGVLANRLRRLAAQLDTQAHDACLADAEDLDAA